MRQFNKNTLKSDLIENYFINGPAGNISTESDVVEYFSNVIKTDHIDYVDKSKQYVDVINTVTKKLGTGISKADKYDSDKAEYLLTALDNEVEDISKVAAKDALALTKLEADYKAYKAFRETSNSNIPDIDAFKDAVYSTAQSMGRDAHKVISAYSKVLAQEDYAIDDDVIDDLDALDGLIALGANPLEVINSNKSAFELAIGRLKAKKDAYEKLEGNEISTTGFTEYETKHKAVDDEFKNSYRELTAHLNAPTADLDGSLKNLFGLLGEEILTNDASLDDEADFTTMVNAYIKDYLDSHHRLVGGLARRPHIDPSYIEETIGDILHNYGVAVASGDLDGKKAALDNVKSFKKELDGARKASVRSAKKDIKRWYKQVMLDSDLDNPLNHTGEYTWSMFDANGKIVENHDKNTYAGAGLGFFRNLMNNVYIRNITNGTYDSIEALKEKVVTKHKAASSWLFRLGHKVPNKKIGVDEVLLWGLYNAIEESSKDNIQDLIRTRWDAVMHLNNRSTLAEIRHTYDLAADLGDELNDDAMSWTLRTNEGYAEMDNKVNEFAGYKAVDKFWDFVNKGLKGAGIKGGNYEKVDETAIKPLYHPNAQKIVGTLGALGLGYFTLDALLTIISSKKSFFDKFNGLFGAVAEGTKEAGISAIMFKLMETAKGHKG